MTLYENIQLIIRIQNSDLYEEEIQTSAEKLLQQLRVLDGVENANLVAAGESPKGAKAIGGFLLGMLSAEVSPANIKKLIFFLGERLGGKQIELTVKTADGRELNLKASSQAEFEFAFLKAQEFLKL